jgi:hypothetical protein
VRGRPQHEDAAEEAAASLRPIWSRVAGSAASHFAISADKLCRCSLKNSIVQGGLHKPQLCTQCTARSQRYQLPNGFLETLKNELKKFKNQSITGC